MRLEEGEWCLISSHADDKGIWEKSKGKNKNKKIRG